MTLYLNFRSQSVGGAIVAPYLLEGNGTTAPPALKTVAWADIAAKVAGKDVLLGGHAVPRGGGDQSRLPQGRIRQRRRQRRFDLPSGVAQRHGPAARLPDGRPVLQHPRSRPPVLPRGAGLRGPAPAGRSAGGLP